MALNDDHTEHTICFGEYLTRLDSDLVYSSEKLLMLEILLKQVTTRASSCVALALENGKVSAETVENALEYDVLSGFVDAEVKGLDDFMASLQKEIVNVHEKISACDHTKESISELEKMLIYCEDFLKLSKDHVSETRVQSAKFQSALASGGKESWNAMSTNFFEVSQFSSMDTKVKQSMERKKSIIRILERSLARELQLEKMLVESKYYQEELGLKLQFAEQEMFSLDELSDPLSKRFFEAENAAEILMGISKELMGKLQMTELNLKSTRQREADMSSKLQSLMQKLLVEQTVLQKLKSCCSELDDLKSRLTEAENKRSLSNAEVVMLKEKVNSQEAQLKESDDALQQENASAVTAQEDIKILSSKIIDLENLVDKLKLDMSKADGRTGSAEKQLRQFDAQLEHAKADVEAYRERQVMLQSSLKDMENLMYGLKAKASKAEDRADIAEANCIQLTDSNFDLTGEVSFLRSQIKDLEASLLEAENAKIATAKDIATRTRLITNMVMQLAMERERLQAQIRSLTSEKSMVEEKYFKKKNDTSFIIGNVENANEEFDFLKRNTTSAQISVTNQEAVTESSATSFQEDRHMKDVPACEEGLETTTSAEDTMSAGSNLETMRTIDAGWITSNHVWLSILIVLISVVAIYLSNLESCPF